MSGYNTMKTLGYGTKEMQMKQINKLREKSL
jgi:hypothetical protein